MLKLPKLPKGPFPVEPDGEGEPIGPEVLGASLIAIADSIADRDVAAAALERGTQMLA